MSSDPLAHVRIHEPPDGDPAATRFAFSSRLEGREVELRSDLSEQPAGLSSAALMAGVKYEDTLDFAVVKLPSRGTASGLFTRNRSCSPCVTVDREHLQDGHAQALVVVSKNANVFTPTAMEDTRELVEGVASALSVDRADVIVSATGVIGVSLPMDKLRAAIASVPDALGEGLSDDVASAILTTDRGPKVASARFGDVSVAGMAKGAGMIEPNMATMLTYYFTDLAVPRDRLDAMVARATEATWNSISVDSDTSTSDSLVVFSTGAVSTSADAEADLEACLTAMFLKLAREVVFQAEGATKLIEATVRGADSDASAKIMAKQIINSPLLKAAIFGADPNWGRVVMAVGKPGAAGTDLHDPAAMTIAVNGATLFSKGAAVALDLDAVSATIRERKKTTIDVDLGAGEGQARVWGCDLSVRLREDQRGIH